MTETLLPQSAIMAVRDLIAARWPDPIPPRCGIAVCGGPRLGVGTYWPIDRDTAAFCGIARCGLARCGRIIKNNALFAGSAPTMYSHAVTLSLTEQSGGPADPRQVYGTAYDNPAMTLHITGEDLLTLDRIAEAIRGDFDGARHRETAHGTINGMTVAPPIRITRKNRPRYEVQLTIDAELERPAQYH